jgi:hypothetical protein
MSLTTLLAGGWSFSFSPVITANGRATDTWTVPLGLGVSNITVIGSQPMSIGINHFNNVIRPSGAGSSQLRLVTSLQFPKKKTGSN